MSEEKAESYWWHYASLKTKQLFLNFLIPTINNFMAFLNEGKFDEESYLLKFPDYEVPFM